MNYLRRLWRRWFPPPPLVWTRLKVIRQRRNTYSVVAELHAREVRAISTHGRTGFPRSVCIDQVPGPCALRFMPPPATR